MRIVPLSVRYVPAITFRIVDFPDPLLPITVRNWPAGIVRLTPRNAGTKSPPGCSNVFSSEVISIICAPLPGAAEA
jgi:hypothetical protein